MKLSVTKGFIDKDTSVFHNVGEVVEYPEKRAKEIECKGFGRCLDEPKPTKPPPRWKQSQEEAELLMSLKETGEEIKRKERGHDRRNYRGSS